MPLFFYFVYCLNFVTNMFRMPGLRPSCTSSFKAHSLSFFFLISTIGCHLFFQGLGRGSYVEPFLPALLRSASAAHSLWTIVSSDLCETVVFHSFHVGIPLSSSNVGPMDYILNSAQLTSNSHFTFW